MEASEAALVEVVLQVSVADVAVEMALRPTADGGVGGGGGGSDGGGGDGGGATTSVVKLSSALQRIKNRYMSRFIDEIVVHGRFLPVKEGVYPPAGCGG